MVEKIILHVGLHKTGSTWLQKNLFPFLDGVNYVDPSKFAKTYDFLKNIKIDNNKINLISYEAFSGYSHNPLETYETRLQIAKNLKRFYPDASIIICTRDKDDWLKSAYRQFSLSVWAYGWKQYVSLFDKRMLDFDAYISFLKELFSDVYVCRFEDFKRSPDRFIHNMCSFIGVGVPKDRDFSVVNVGFPVRKLSLLILLDSLFKYRRLHFIVQWLIKLVRTGKDSR
jgi:hypothetical protein